jgi:hypothetical protein
VGPEGLRDLLAARLAERLPPVLTALEVELGLVAGVLRPPSLLAPVEARLLAVEHFPAILVTLLDVPTLEVVDWGPPVELRLETAARVLAYARGGSYEEAGTARDRYILAVRRAVLASRVLVDVAGQRSAGVQVETYRESYSEVGRDRSRRSVAAAFAEFRLVSHEKVAGL